MGVNVRSLKRQVVSVMAALVGLAVACGIIGFIGLRPHLARLLTGQRTGALPLAMLLFGGMLLVLVGCTGAQPDCPPAEIPVGMLTALVGDPFISLLA